MEYAASMEMQALEEPIKCVGDFLKAVAIIRETWQLEARRELWFRGEGKDYSNTKLRPALYRSLPGKALKSPSDLIRIEDDLFAHFQRNSVEFAKAANEDTSSDWLRYFLMQHHGGPTRLLDWSDGALVALHFALREDEHSDRFVYVLDSDWLVEYIEAETSDYAIAKETWAKYCQKHPSMGLDEDDWDRAYLPDQHDHDEIPVPKFPLVLEFGHFIRRISAQRSRFVLMGSAPDFFNTLLGKTDARTATIKIESNSVASMRVELRDAGITESVIYPDLDGLGRELKQLWTERLRERD